MDELWREAELGNMIAMVGEGELTSTLPLPSRVTRDGMQQPGACADAPEHAGQLWEPLAKAHLLDQTFLKDHPE